MNIEVIIKIRDEFDQELESKVSSKEIDNDITNSGISSSFDLLIDHIKRALLGLGYREKTIDDYFSQECSGECDCHK